MVLPKNAQSLHESLTPNNSSQVRDYAKICAEKVVARFGTETLLKPSVIFDTAYKLEQQSFTEAVEQMATIFGKRLCCENFESCLLSVLWRQAAP